MKRFSFLLIFLTALSAHAQDENTTTSSMPFFGTLEGTWKGMPTDTSFISILNYQIKNQEYFVSVSNDLMSPDSHIFSHYEGVYFFNPNTSRMEYTTLNKSEIHSGYCLMRSDTLYHFATVKNTSDKIKAYASAIIVIDDQTLAYFATYAQDERIPELVLENPLIYKKVKK
jgi:hypothetical protein